MQWYQEREDSRKERVSGMELVEICKKAKETKAEIANLGTNEKNEALKAVAEALVAHAPEIIAANEKDLENGKKKRKPIIRKN